MRIKKILCLFALVLMLNLATFADSPLTSTDFSEAYSNEKIIAAAAQSNGVLTDELMEFLVNKKNKIDLKMAVVNKLGWDTNGKNNSEKFLDFVLQKHKYADKETFLKKGKAEDLLTMAYLKALDNYFDVTEATEIAEIALNKKSKSRTFNLIAGLIKAQKAMDSNWCEVYQITDRIRQNSKLKTDLKPEAIKIIYDYMDIYKTDCK